MDYFSATHPKEFQELLRRLRDASIIAYDTEFISEGRYQPQLCLVQIATEKELALIDPLSVGALEPFWEILCEPERQVVVHACRSEMEFCFREIGRMPKNLFDVQVAAGFVGLDYPTSFRTLVEKTVKIDLPKDETRTQWDKRPLTSRQISYALDDVRYLCQIYERLRNRLETMNRSNWFAAEIGEVKTRLTNDFTTSRWRSVPKSSSLKPRPLAIVREIWLWRDAKAKKEHIPPGRILRDDLIVELSKRNSSSPERIKSIRGLQGKEPSVINELSAVIEKALKLPDSELPAMAERYSYPQYAVMTQFLTAALSSICRQNRIAMPLVGGPSDVREMIAVKLGTLPHGKSPRLLKGWRAELVGNRLDNLLCGNTAIRLDPTTPEEPLQFLE